ncbi:hypothetical protein ACQ4M3_38880 [Leptolyngbya sp. AN03gr2]|uniref:hypothetical protein n=1 Tax=unclassified Leptolyngbya TaxID=2650499 RepID=UPI003D314377
MTLAYVVTDRETDVAILKKLLPSDLAQHLTFYAAHGKYSARSAAGTLLSDRMRPVALVLDADTDNPVEVGEKIELVNTMLYPASSPETPFKVFLAAPSIPSLLSSSFVDNAELVEMLNHLSPAQIQAVQQHPLIQQLIEFLSNATRQVAS